MLQSKSFSGVLRGLLLGATAIAITQLVGVVHAACPAGTAGNDTCLIDSSVDQTVAVDGLGQSTADILQLGGSVAFSFNASRIGTTYTNWEVFQKVGTATATLTGVAGVDTDWNIIGGTLLASGGSAIFDSSSITVGNGATFGLQAHETIGSLSGVAGSAVGLGSFFLTTGGNNDTTFAGVMSGTGGLNKVGAGSFTLAGSNTYGGTTAINSGTLVLSGGSALSDSSAVVLAGNGRLSLLNSETVGSLSGVSGSLVTLGSNTLTAGGKNSDTIFGGVISGTGGLTKAGTGTMTLTGDNTYTGLTMISGGVLQVQGEDAIDDSSDVHVGAGGTLMLLDSEQVGALSGSAGSIIDLGLYTLLAGDDTDTIFAGDITGSVGTISVNLDPDPSDADPTTVPTDVSVAGGVIKTGAGTLTLSGNNSYVGDTFVQQGILILSGGSAIADTGFIKLGEGVTLRLASSETIGALSGLGAVTGGVSSSVPPSFPGSLDICQMDPTSPGCSGSITYPSVLGSTVDLGSFTLTTNGAINPVLPTDVQQGSAFGGNIIGTGNLIKEGSGELMLSGTNTYSGFTRVNLGKLTVSGGQALSDVTVVTLNNTATLNLLGGERIGSLVGGASSAVTLGTSTLTTGDASNTVFDGAISGSGGLTKVGTGSFTLGGTNTFTGATQISSGRLLLENGAALANTSLVSIADGAALELIDGETIGRLSGVAGSLVELDSNVLTINATGTAATFAGQITGAGGIIKTGAGVQRLSGANTYAGTTAVNGGVLELAGGLAILDTGAMSIGGSGTLSLLATETIGGLSGAAGGLINLNAYSLMTGDASSTTFAGVISGTGGLYKKGAGSLTLSGVNTFSGGSFINNGSMVLDGGSALSDVSAVTIAATGVLELLESEMIGALVGVTGAGVDLNSSTLTINATAGSMNFAGSISGTGGLTKTGTGIQVLSGGNTYTGPTLVNGGVLALSGGSAIDDGGAVTVGSGTLQLLSSETIGSLAGVAPGVVDLGVNTLSTGDAANTEFGGSIIGSGSLVKLGSGVFTLSGDNSHTGTTSVHGGTLALKEGSAIADEGAVVVASGATLQLLSSESIGNLSGVTGASVELGANVLMTGDGSNTIFAGTLSGTGGLVKKGAGVFSLSGVNTFSGGATVTAGTLELSGGSALFDGSAVHIEAGGVLSLLSSETIGALSGSTGAAVALGANVLTIETNGEAATFSGTILGSGSLVKTGSGRQFLTGANDYSGSTNVNGGTLAVSGGAAIADASQVIVASGATFEVAGSETIARLSGDAGSSLNLAEGTLTAGDAADTTFAGAIFGPGGLSKQGSGVFTLSGTNTSTGVTSVNAGTLALAGGAAIGDTGAVVVAGGATLTLVDAETIGSLAGAGSVVLGANTLTTGDDTDTMFAGTIEGAGGMTKTGSGKFSTASLGYSGLTTINAGELNANGAIAGSVLVNAGGILSGSNIIRGDLTNLGTLQSGNSPGSTIVGGNFVGGGLMSVEVQLSNVGAPSNGVTHDFLQIDGSVTGTTLIAILPVAPSSVPVETTGLGVELVRVGGNVGSSAFALAGPVVSGGFEYLLHYEQDYNGSTDGFFLRSSALQELSLNAALLSLGRASTTMCSGLANVHPGLDGRRHRAYGDVRHGTISAGKDTGVAFDASHNCFSAGADVAIDERVFIGVSGSYGKTEADVLLQQGTAKLTGDGGRYQAHAGYTNGNFFALAALGYAKTEWDVAKAGGGSYIADVKGQLGHLAVGYKLSLDKGTSLTLSGRVDYNGAACGDDCLIAGAVENVPQWGVTAAARLDATIFNDTVRPYVALALSDELGEGNTVEFGGSIARSDVASKLVDADIGFDASVAQHVSLFAQARRTHGFDTEVEGYAARAGFKLSF